MADPAPSPSLDLLLVARYGLLVSLTHLIPIPVLDWLVEGWLRNRLTRVQLHGFDISMKRKQVTMLASGDAGGCLGLLWSVVSWPFRRLLRYILWVLIIKAMVDTFSDVVARAILVHEACAVGALPGDAVSVRAAMQRARNGLNTKPLERAVGIVYRSLKGELWKLWRQARGRMRQESARARRDEAWSAADEEPLEGGLEGISEALARAIWVPEVHTSIRRRFREELEMAGLIDESQVDADADRDVEVPDAEDVPDVVDLPERAGQATPAPDPGGEADPDGPEDSETDGGSDVEADEADR